MKTVTFSANTSWYLFNFRAQTIRAIIERGYRVVCLSPEDNYSSRLSAELGAEWVNLAVESAGKNPLADAKLMFCLYLQYRAFRPVAAFHFTIKNNIYGTFAAKLLSIPAVNNISGLGTAFLRKGLAEGIARLLYRTSQRLAHTVFCQNPEDFRLISERRWVVEKRLRLIPGSGVNLERFHPGLRTAKSGPFRFLYAGRMLADKGLFELTDAILRLHDQHSDCELWLCGFTDVDNVSAVSGEQLSEWGAKPYIRWLGSSDQIEKVYAQVDCVVLPSYREGMPRSLLEAGAMGLPVVATDVPGCRTVITDGLNGLLCQARDTSSLYQALRQMLAMTTSQREQMGIVGRERVVANYDERLVVNEALEVLERL